MDFKNRIRQLASEHAGEVVGIRRHIHAHPELSFQEYKTAEYIAGKLKDLGLQVQEGVAETGVVAILKAKNPGKKVLALRADIDALPIVEQNSIPYKSLNEGVMHACGHDVHTASLLGTAAILSELRDEFEGTVKFIFQPGEEKAPGGASIMIKEGVSEKSRTRRNPGSACDDSDPGGQDRIQGGNIYGQRR